MYSITGFTKSELALIARMILADFPSPKWIYGRRRLLTTRQKVEITLTYLRRNRTQQEIADEFGVSQPLISDVIKEYTHKIVEVFKCEIPSLSDLEKHAKRESVLVDGTFITRSKHVYDPDLHSGKHHASGHNLQIVSTLDGRLLYVSEPLPGKTHDAKAIRDTKILDHIVPENTLADKGYVGLGLITPIKNRTGEELAEWEKAFNKDINSMRSAVERCIAHYKRWKIIATGYRRPLKTLQQTIHAITALEFLKRSF